MLRCIMCACRIPEPEKDARPGARSRVLICRTCSRRERTQAILRLARELGSDVLTG